MMHDTIRGVRYELDGQEKEFAYQADDFYWVENEAGQFKRALSKKELNELLSRQSSWPGVFRKISVYPTYLIEESLTEPHKFLSEQPLDNGKVRRLEFKARIYTVTPTPMVSEIEGHLVEYQAGLYSKEVEGILGRQPIKKARLIFHGGRETLFLTNRLYTTVDTAASAVYNNYWWPQSKPFGVKCSKDYEPLSPIFKIVDGELRLNIDDILLRVDQKTMNHADLLDIYGSKVKDLLKEYLSQDFLDSIFSKKS